MDRCSNRCEKSQRSKSQRRVRESQGKEGESARKVGKVAKLCVFPSAEPSGRMRKNCTWLWREAKHISSQKNHHVPSPFGSWDVKKCTRHARGRGAKIPVEINPGLPKCRVPTLSLYKMVFGHLQNGSPHGATVYKMVIPRPPACPSTCKKILLCPRNCEKCENHFVRQNTAPLAARWPFGSDQIVDNLLWMRLLLNISQTVLAYLKLHFNFCASRNRASNTTIVHQKQSDRLGRSSGRHKNLSICANFLEALET